MRNILAIFGIVFLIGIIFVIPYELEKNNGIEKYSFRYLTQKNNTKNEVDTVDKISFNMDLRLKSKYTAEDYNKMLSGTGLQGLGETFKECDDIGINSLFIVALACHESNYGNSALSRDKNNIFGFMAYDRDPYNCAKSFSTKNECIRYVSMFLRDNYLNENGIYFNGYTITSINVKYASDSRWSDKVYTIMENLQKRYNKM